MTVGDREGLALRQHEDEALIVSGNGDGRMPRHVAIIMDGNGRWAHARSLPRSAGHRQGIEAVRRTIRAALDLRIEYLTIFSFSSENWSRPASEVSDLLALMRRFVRQDVAELHAAGVRVRIIGEREGLSSDIAAMIEDTERLTRANRAMTLIVAFNYGARQELTSVVRKLAERARRGEIDPASISPEVIANGLYASDIPDPDLLIRTSGEQRLSNFLLWQCAYTELVFVSERWPDFSRETFMRAIEEFRTRDRRFGGLAAGAL